MRVPRQMVEEMIAHAREEAPNECCGMIGGADGSATTVYRSINAEASPLRYSLDASDQFRIMQEMEKRGEELVGIYHSHTASAAYPSQTDVNLAAYPDAVYVIVSLEDPENPDVRGFWIRDGQIDEADLDVV
ncbi:MAG: M67 family metallopeptidase [Actinomycetota bacterium]|nr:M67 family metallopeptidase [Actinomycetota bacterium]